MVKSETSKNRIMNLLLTVCLSVTLVISGLCPNSVLQVQASQLVTINSPKDLIRGILGKQGIFPSDSHLEKYADSFSEEKIEGLLAYYNLLDAYEEQKENLKNGAIWDVFSDGIRGLGSAVLFIMRGDIDTLISVDQLFHIAGDMEYTVPDKVIDAMIDSWDSYIQKNGDFFYLKTHKPSDLIVEKMGVTAYDNAFYNMSRNSQYHIYGYIQGYRTTYENLNYVPRVVDGYHLVLRSIGSLAIDLYTYSNDCVISGHYYKNNESNRLGFYLRNAKYEMPFHGYEELYSSDYVTHYYDPHKLEGIFSSDGRMLKVWRNETALYKYLNKMGQSVYYGSNYQNYDNSQDNSYTFTGDYYEKAIDNRNYYEDINNSVTNYYNENTEVNEGDIYNIVNNYYTVIENDGNGGTGGSGGIGTGDNDGFFSKIWKGVNSILNGIGSVVGDVVDLLGRMIQEVIESLGVVLVSGIETLFVTLTTFTSGFGTFMTATYGFLPPDGVAVLVAGITLMVVLGIIKFLKG